MRFLLERKIKIINNYTTGEVSCCEIDAGQETDQVMDILTMVKPSEILSNQTFKDFVNHIDFEKLYLPKVEVLEEESDIKDPVNPITKVKDGSIEFRNVNFS